MWNKECMVIAIIKWRTRLWKNYVQWWSKEVNLDNRISLTVVIWRSSWRSVLTESIIPVGNALLQTTSCRSEFTLTELRQCFRVRLKSFADGRLFPRNLRLGVSKYVHFTPVLKTLHRLPIKQRIEFRLVYLSTMTLHANQPFRSLPTIQDC